MYGEVPPKKVNQDRWWGCGHAYGYGHSWGWTNVCLHCLKPFSTARPWKRTHWKAKASNHFLFLFSFSLFLDFHNRDRRIAVNVSDVGEVKLTAADHLGDLLLGKLSEEYIEDPDLRGILACAVLDADKMIPYQHGELFLMTSVVYSEKFEVVGKRKQEVCTFSPFSLWTTFRVCLCCHIMRLFPA